MRGHDLVNPGALRIEFVIRNMFEYLPFGKIPHWEIVANNDDPSDIARDHLLDDFMNRAAMLLPCNESCNAAQARR